ncbi:MAG TPA: ABC transporter permease [Azospirillum sp.]|nr:ABC transporter permease [Azospirillum sp.]
MSTSKTAIGPTPDRFRVTNDQPLAAALGDLAAGLKQWRIWTLLSWHDIKLRYRGSLLGPFWLSISMGVTIGALAIVYGSLFDQDLSDYVPYLTCGFIAWGLILGTLSEGCVAFVGSEAFIKQIRLPLSVFVYRVACRNAIILAHNFTIYFIVIAVFRTGPGWIGLLAVAGMAGVMVSLLWAVLTLGMVCARFRDVSPIVSNIMQLAFFITPIIWKPEDIKQNDMVVDANPFYHFIEVIRAPLLGHMPTATNWAVVVAIGLFGWGLAIVLYRRFRSRIAFWV